ncbi:MAG: ATP-binding protein [Thermodesulfobacteriota bacterium]
MEDFFCNQTGSSIACNFASSLVNIDRTVDAVKDFLDRRDIVISQFELVFVLRESLNNAVIHGNENDSRRRVDCTLRLARDTINITVTDQGKGFDWRQQLSRTPVATSTTSGRGLNAMLRYGFAMRFNAAGNTLYLTKKIR